MHRFVAKAFWGTTFMVLTTTMAALAACGGGKPANSACGAPCGGCGCGSGEVDAARVTQPDGWKPNTDGLDDSALLARGLELWKDKSLSKAGNASCDSCHGSVTAMFKDSFAQPYPHEVAMAAEKSGKKSVSAAEMVQFCMVVPMGAEPLGWDDVKLAALTKAVEEKQSEYKQATGK